MAETLHRKASVSTTWRPAPGHGGDAVAFFLLLIPHLDRYGCAPADPIRLRGMVIPLWADVSDADVRGLDRWLLRRRMLERVARSATAGRACVRPAFHDHQTGAHLEPRGPSTYEPPDGPDQAGREVRARQGRKAGKESLPRPLRAHARKGGRTRPPRAREPRARASRAGYWRPAARANRT